MLLTGEPPLEDRTDEERPFWKVVSRGNDIALADKLKGSLLD